jgi:hypothetical protein
MKLISVVYKSLAEQLRSFWILILTISMAPIFVFIYYLILESYKPQYKLLLLNQDIGIEQRAQKTNYGELLIQAAKYIELDTEAIPLKVQVIEDRKAAIKKLKSRKADALVIIPENFSQGIYNLVNNKESKSIEI